MELSERLKNLSPAKRALLMKALREQAGESVDQQAIPRRPENVSPPLSFAQQRLWFLDQMQPGSGYYNMPLAVRLQGWLDLSAIEQSANEIVARHEALRTTFQMTSAGPIQVIHDVMAIRVPVINLTTIDGDQQQSRLRELIRDEANRGFDLAAGPLVRGAVLKLGETDHVVLFTLHHIVGDGWSFGVFLREVTALYAAFSSGQSSPLAALPIQYADFACWQRDWLQGERLDSQIEYWKKQLADLEQLELPVDKLRPAMPTDRGALLTTRVPRDLATALQDLSRKHGCTLFMTLLAAFQTLLLRYTGQDDIAVGTPTANRIRPELEYLIGFFANTLVLRTDLCGDPTFLELLERVRPVVLGAFSHQDVPFEMVVEALQPERVLGHNPLFRVAFALQNAPLPPVELPGLKEVRMDIEGHTTRFDLTLALAEDANGLGVSWEYSSELFDSESISRMSDNFKSLLRAIVAHPDTHISRLPLLVVPPRRPLAANAKLQSLVDLFEARATVSYRELNEQANQLAHHLIAAGVKDGSAVSLQVKPGEHAAVALLGALKAGGAIMALDGGESAATFVITEQTFELARDQSRANPDVSIRADQIAYYVMSTRTPVGVSHAAALQRLTTLQDVLLASGTDAVTFVASPGTEMATWALLWPFVQKKGDEEAAPPSPTIVNRGPLRRDVAERLKEQFAGQVLNVYTSPTAGIIAIASVDELLAQPGNATDVLPVGRPVHSGISIRDRNSEIVPNGVWGEVCFDGSTFVRTGDRGRRRNDGFLEIALNGGKYGFIAGFRVDLDVVTATLLEEPTVTDCVTRIRIDDQHRQWLVLYVVWSGAVSRPQLRSRLERLLPDSVYRHTSIVPISVVPLKASGLIDEAALDRIEVLDEDLVSRWERQLLSIPSIQDVVVLPREATPVLPPLHLSDVFSTNIASDVPTASTKPQQREAPPRVNEKTPAISDGVAIHLQTNDPRVLQDSLRRAATETSNGVVYIQADGSEVNWTYKELLAEAEQVLRGLRNLGLNAGDRVLFQFKRNQDFLSAFWACVLGGFVPVPAALPASYRQPSTGLNRLQASWEMLDRPLVLAGLNEIRDVRLWATEASLNMQIAALEELQDEGAGAESHVSKPNDVALILLTSGSTGLPKGVQLTHRNLLMRSASTRQLNGFSKDEITINWLPLDHVGGIVYFHLRDVFLRCRQIHAPTASFLEDPLRWLDWIEHYHATVTWAPNFAFGLINDRGAELERKKRDLSSIRFISNGGEAVVARTARRFLQLLGPHGLASNVMHPAWGMSETSSGVTYSYEFLLESTSDDDAFVEVGPPIPGVSMRIVDDNDLLLSMGEVGRLQIRGETITSGYYGKPEVNAEAFTADGWFRTGDLGVLREGRLTITGREKDVIIIGGSNFSSHEIESVVEEIDGVDTSFTAACAVRGSGGSDRLAVFFSTSESDFARRFELIDKIREQVVRSVGVKPDFTVPLRRDEIPKTSIGKIQHAQLRERFEKGEYEVLLKQIDIETGNANTIPDWFYQRVWQRREAKFGDGCLISEIAPQISLIRQPSLNSTVVFLDALSLGASCCDSSAIRVESGTTFQRVGTQHYRIDPREPNQYKQLFESLAADGVRVGEIVHFWTYEKYSGEITTAEALARAQDRGVYSLLFLVQALARTRAADDTTTVRMLVVSNHSQSVSTSDPVAAEKATMLGLIRTIPQEISWLHCRHIDLDAMPVADATAIMRRERTTPSREGEVAYRGGRRFVPRLEKIEFRGKKRKPSLFENGGMVVITGGLGGIGVEIARHLLREHQSRILLIGRTPLPDRSLWPSHLAKGDELARRIESLIALERLGGSVAYAPADVSDSALLKQVVEEWKSVWNCRLNGVIHLAGVFHERLLIDETRETFDAALHAKVAGTWALHQVAKAGPDCAFVSFASVNGMFGGATAGAYAAANSFADAFARSHSSGADHYCFNWSMWDGVGMSREYQQKELSRTKGYYAITAQQGMQSFLMGLSYREKNLVAGLDGGNSNIRRALKKTSPIQVELAACFTTSGDDAVLALDTIKLFDRFNTPSRCTFIRIEKMPKTETGEIDRDELQTLIGTRRSAAKRVLPRNEIERRIAQIWEDVLHIPQVGIHDNFFELGGDSILAIQAISRANQVGLRFVPAQLFQHQTIAGLASVCQLDEGSTAEQGLVQGPVPLTPIQHWFFEQDLPAKHHFNMALMLKISRPLDSALMSAAVERILLHHDALRMRYEREGDGWRQWHALPEDPGAVPIFAAIDMSAVVEAEVSNAIEKSASELQSSLDLAQGPIIRVIHFNLGEGRPGRLLFIIHHLVMDGLSWRVILEDLFTAYEQLSRGLAVTLPLKSASFQAWANGLVEYARIEASTQSYPYWRALQEHSMVDIPVDHAGGENTIAELASIASSLTEEETQAILQDVPKVYHTQINDVLLTALVQTVAKWTGQRSLLIDLEGHGREDVLGGMDVSRTLGWFTSLFPVRLDIAQSTGVGEELKAVKEQLRQIPERGIGFGILRYLSPDPTVRQAMRSAVQPQISFNYLGQVNTAAMENAPLGVEAAPESFGPAFSPLAKRRHLLDVVAIVVGGTLRIDWAYSKAVYDTGTIEALARDYSDALRAIIAHCQSPEAGGYTPSDFPLASLDDAALSQVLSQVEFDSD